MPPSTRRSSLPSVTALPPDEISALSLTEVRARLERNERVLNSSIFSPPRSPSLPNIASSSTSPTPDPVREKLLVSRQQLLHREQELLMAQMDDGIEKMGVGSLAESSASARRRSRSGKVRALERIQAGEGRLAKNGVLLPIAETLSLSERDSSRATAQSLANMSLSQVPQSPSTKPRSRRLPPDPDPGGNDEISRAQAAARMRAFMSFKGDEDLLDEDGDDWGGGEGEGEYDGDGDRMVIGSAGRGGVRRERGTGEEVDGIGEDEEGWAEGNEEYYDRVTDR